MFLAYIQPNFIIECTFNGCDVLTSLENKIAIHGVFSKDAYNCAGEVW